MQKESPKTTPHQKKNRHQKIHATRSSKKNRRQHRQAKRRRRRQHFTPLPGPIRRICGALLDAFMSAFCRPTYERFVLLLFAAILTTGPRTILNLLRLAPALMPGHPSSYHRVFSHRPWSIWFLARALAGFIIKRWLPTGTIHVVGDDTVTQHTGDNVYGKGCHRDAVQSSKAYTAFCWGHKWVVLAILVKFSFATRPWALPVMAALYRSKEWYKTHGRRHKTPVMLVRQMLAALSHWFPDRHFVFTGDGNFAAHELARFGQRHQRRLTIVSRFYPDAGLYELPPVKKVKKGKKGSGRPRVKGKKMLKPEEVVAKTRRRQHLNVAWYGGGRRDVSVVTGFGHWYQAGCGLVALRWVFVHDRSGTHRDEYFFSTTVTMSAQEIIESYTGRWNIETTFQEMRSQLKLETSRGWTEKTVLRVEPCLFGLYAVIAVWYAELPARWRQERGLEWAGKKEVTFSDAITAVRRWLWVEWVFSNPAHRSALAKIPKSLLESLLRGLAPGS